MNAYHDPKSIYIDIGESEFEFRATQNLHAALVQLRDPFFEQILWVDAVCINQKDDDEKAQQVAAMARIYGLAKRVVAWLGKEADESALAFQELRNLALENQPIDHHSLATKTSGPDAKTEGGQMAYRVSAEQAVRALLNRTYFRRMCGNTELQTATFLSGLDAMEHLDDWELRSRIRAFIVLIKSSAFRESLKGQAHLNVEPLVDLIDRFHAHDATDPRDKIYALWGLSSDSEKMQKIQPDYKKTWKNLLEDLGRLVFGDGATLLASSHSQMMFVRSAGYDLGKIDELSNAGGVWENSQELKITSMRASRFLDSTRKWSLWVSMRAPADQIQRDDIALFLPNTGRLIIARPRKYYLQIVMIIDSRLVQTYIPGNEQSEGGWTSWQPWLENMDDSTEEFPFIWTWERSYEGEEREALMLMGDIIRDPLPLTYVDEPQAILKARALSKMASLLMSYDDYEQAASLLLEIVNIYNEVYGSTAETSVAGHARLATALERKTTYQKAKIWLNELQERKSYLHMESCCIRVALEVASWMPVEHPPNNYTPPHVWLDLTSKLISRGVSKEMLLNAINLCQLPGDDPPLENPEQVQDYLHFLLDMAEGSISLSATELLAATYRQMAHSNFIQLARCTTYPIDNLAEILDVRRVRKTPGLFIWDLIAELGDCIVVTPEAINVAAKWDEAAVSALLEAAKDTYVVTPSAFTVALLNYGDATLPIIELLAQNAEPGCEILEETMLTMLTSTQSAALHNDIEYIFVALIEHPGVIVKITERILYEAVISFKVNILSLLRYRQDTPISDKVYEQIRSMEVDDKVTKDSLFEILSDLEDCAKPLKQEDIDAIPADDIKGYASIINLVRYRNREFTITENVILKAALTNKKAPAWTSWIHGEDDTPWKSLLIIEKFTSFLIKHAAVEVIESLRQSPTIIEAAASRGYPRVLEALRIRSEDAIPHFEALSLAAQICQFIQRPTQPGETHTRAIEALVRRLGKTEHQTVSDDIKRAICLHARQGVFGDADAVVEMLLEHDVVDVDLIKTFSEAPTRSMLQRTSTSVGKLALGDFHYVMTTYVLDDTFLSEIKAYKSASGVM
ncbi:hypothetical protein N0V90_011949 [Kalmusia sp. IMI 367209]|nr:hypothetical protein N0V90_011949 [Kalmusia sp. IMI 367209]